MAIPKSMMVFKGEVSFIGCGPINTKFRLFENSCVIKARNDLHIKMVESQFRRYPESFIVIAPIFAIEVVSGTLPKSHMCEMSPEEYTLLRNQYYNIKK